MAYADGGERWLDEDAPLDRSAARAAICNPVRTMEAMVRAIAPASLGWSILRGGWFVGPGTAQEATIAGLRAGTEKIIAGGAHYLPLVHVEDVASAFVLAIQREIAAGVLNVNAEPVRQRDYLERLAVVAGAPPPGDAAGPAPISVRSSAARAMHVLGWRPAKNLIDIPK
jgi:nucleoside-diphosphate-sugar epimerase